MFLQILTIVLLCLTHVSKCHFYVETEKDSFLEKWREDNIEKKNFYLSLLKTINFNTIESYYEGMGLRISFSIYGMNLTGLDNFKVNRIKSEQKEKKTFLDIAIDIPGIKLHSDHYKINGKAYYVYPLQGEGNLEVEFINTTVLLNLKYMSVNQSKIIIEDITFDFDVKDIKVDLQNSSWPLNNIFNEHGVAMLKSYRGDISNALKEYVVPYIYDYYLSKLQPK